MIPSPPHGISPRSYSPVRSRTRSTGPVALLLAMAALSFSVPAIGQDRLAIRAGRILTGLGETIEGGTLLIENGRVKALGTDVAIPSGVRVVDRSQATLAPGFIDCCSYAGAPNDRRETADPIDLEDRLIDVFDPAHRDFALLAAAGVTAVVILPDRGNVVGGVGAVVKTAGKDRIVRDDRPLALSLGAAAWQGRDRYPTSLMSAIRLLDESLVAAKKSRARVATPLVRLLAGEVPAVAWVDAEAQIRALADLRDRHGFTLAILAGTSLRTSLERLRGTKITVGLRCLDLGSGRRATALPGVVERAGIPVTFYGETPRTSPESLRLSATIAVQEGMSPEGALAAITSNAAAMAGVAGRIGRIAVGADADFVVLDGDPVDASAALLETWIAGRRVHARRVQEESR